MLLSLLKTHQPVAQIFISGYCPVSHLSPPSPPFPCTGLIAPRLNKLQIFQANVNCCYSLKYGGFFPPLPAVFVFLNKDKVVEVLNPNIKDLYFAVILSADFHNSCNSKELVSKSTTNLGISPEGNWAINVPVELSTGHVTPCQLGLNQCLLLIYSKGELLRFRLKNARQKGAKAWEDADELVY